MGTFVLTTAIFKNGGNKCHRNQVIVYLKSESPETYTGIQQLLFCMPYLLRYRDIEFGNHFEKWLSPHYAQFLKFPSSRILKPYVYITQINSQTWSSTKCLRAYRAGPGWEGGQCNFHATKSYTCGNCDPDSPTCSDKPYTSKYVLACPMHQLLYQVETAKRAKNASSVIHPDFGRGHSNLPESDHSVFVRFRAKDLNIK